MWIQQNEKRWLVVVVVVYDSVKLPLLSAVAMRSTGTQVFTPINALCSLHYTRKKKDVRIGEDNGFHVSRIFSQL